VKLAGLFARRSQPVVTGTKVLVCSLDQRFHASFAADSAIYLRYYRHVDAVQLSSLEELFQAIEGAYDIVHLFCPLAPGGLLMEASATPLSGSDLIAWCCERDVKLIWIANENKADDYIKGFRAAGKVVNLIMTIGRNGTKFEGFLEKLLSRISNGESLPGAWAALAPQARGPGQEVLPLCIFLAGRGGVKLVS